MSQFKGPEFDPAEHDMSTGHIVSEDNDLALYLRSGVDISAVKGLTHLLQLRHQEALPPELVETMRKVQNSHGRYVPNTFQKLREQLDEDYPEEANASGDDVSDLPPVA